MAFTALRSKAGARALSDGRTVASRVLPASTRLSAPGVTDEPVSAGSCGLAVPPAPEDVSLVLAAPSCAVSSDAPGSVDPHAQRPPKQKSHAFLMNLLMPRRPAGWQRQLF